LTSINQIVTHPKIFMNSRSLLFLLAAAWVASAWEARAEWTASNLTFSGQAFLLATTGTQQAGSENTHAGIWSGSGAGFVDLNPAGAAGSILNATTGMQQAGFATIGGTAHAGIWFGSAASFVDLHPAGATLSLLYATTGAQQAGYAVIGGVYHGGIWSGSAASFVDLTPVGATTSALYATTGTQQAGFATVVGSPHAGIWSGSSGSFVDLHPMGATTSILYGTTGSQQAGMATISGNNHAGIWSGTAASFVDLNPAGATASELHATIGTRQAGFATFGGKDHAGIWTGTAGSFVDLHAFLPAGYESSQAQAIWSDGATILVAGFAYHTSSGLNQAILWKYVFPQPGLAVSGKKKIVTLKAKAVVKGKATGEVTSVTYKIGKRTRTATGTAAWKFVARLKPGRTIITVIAHGPGGDSAPAKVIVIRK
jgi:hypothetical protein